MARAYKNNDFSIGLWPFGCQAAFALRDDDISYFTDPKKLLSLYDAIWSKIPISFSVIPYLKANNDINVPPTFRGTKRVYSIDANENLIVFLNKILKERKADVSLHGYTHESLGETHEFCFRDQFTLREKIKRGRDLLEKTFNRKVRVFIPPHDQLSRSGVSAVIKEGMHLARCCSYLEFLKTVPLTHNLTMLMKLFFQNSRVFGHTATPRLTIFKTHIDMQESYMLFSYFLKDNTLNEMKREFKKVISRGDLFYLALHSYDFFTEWEHPNLRMLDLFNDFLDFMKKYLNTAKKERVWFTTLEKIAEWIECLQTLNIRRDGRELKINSSRDITGLTISTTNKISCNNSIREVETNNFVLNFKKEEPLIIRI